MPIRFRCKHCQCRLSVASRKAGARAKCPKCGAKITVPDNRSSSASGDSKKARSTATAPSQRTAAQQATATKAASARKKRSRPSSPDQKARPDGKRSQDSGRRSTQGSKPEETAATRSPPTPAAAPSDNQVIAKSDAATAPLPQNDVAVSAPTGPPVVDETPQHAPDTQDFKPAPQPDAEDRSSEVPEAAPEEVEPSRLPEPADPSVESAGAEPAGAAESEVPTESLSEPPTISTGEPEDDPFAEFLVYDDETELVYEDDQDDQGVWDVDLPFDPTKVTFKRSLLYAQGALLGVVAIIGFAIGTLFGGAGAGSHSAVVDEPQPCIIAGTVVLRTQDSATIADHGAVAIVLPQGARPESKLEILGLRPQDPELPLEHPSMLAVHNLGGDVVRADEEGGFRLHVADRGNYFLLVISANRRNPGVEIPKAALAQIGRFFQLTPDLFGGHDFRWQEETVRSDRQLNFVF